MKTIFAAIATSAILATGAQAQQKVYTSETAVPGGSSHSVMAGVGLAVRRAELGEMQIQDGQTLTTSLLNIALGKTDMATVPTAAHALLTEGKGPYQKVGAEKGVQLANSVQAIFGFQAGYYMPIAFDDIGVSSFDDFAGKRIFVGPPSGAAAVNQMSLIEGVTGMKANEGYEAVRMDWASANQAAYDRRFDVFMFPDTIPSAKVEQLASAGNITIFGIPAATLESPEWQALVSQSGTAQSYIPAGTEVPGVTFANKMADGRVPMMGYTFYVGINAATPEDEVYALTKSVIDNLAEINASATFMKGLRLDEAIVGLESTPGLKMHPGAVKAWEESGLAIPDALK